MLNKASTIIVILTFINFYFSHIFTSVIETHRDVVCNVVHLPTTKPKHCHETNSNEGFSAMV